MTRLLSALAVLAPLLVVPATAQDFNERYFAYTQGDYETALKEWRPLAERGHTLAQYNLGRMYYTGDGVPQDYKEAKKWFDRTAAQEYAPAQTSLGVLYDEGQGVRRDYNEAVNGTVSAPSRDTSRPKSGSDCSMPTEKACPEILPKP